MGNCSSSPATVDSNAAIVQGKPESLKVVKKAELAAEVEQQAPTVSPEVAETAANHPESTVQPSTQVDEVTIIMEENISPAAPSPDAVTDSDPIIASPVIEQATEAPVTTEMPAPKPYVLTATTKGMLRIEATQKFAAFCLPVSAPAQETSPASTALRSSGGPARPLPGRPKTFSRQPSRKVNYLRNTLKKLSMMDLSALDDEDSPQPASAAQQNTQSLVSPFSPVRPTETNAHLLSLASCNDIKLCDACDQRQVKGVSCLSQHFLCTACFCGRVRDMTANPEVLKKHDFAIFCPVEGCRSPPWNSYHVRKLLDGPTLQGYLDVLLNVCSEAGRTGAATGIGGATNGDAIAPFSPRPLERNGSARAASGGAHRYLTETTEVLREQLRKLNVIPMEYIPLPEIRAELQGIFDKLNNDQPYDEKRMDFLLMCMELNPVYRAEKEETARLWREEMNVFASECLQTMRGYVPSHIAEATLQSLQEKDGLHVDLAKRLLSKRCLWLVRMRVVDIERIHEVDLMGPLNPIAQGLDIVELAAIYASVPEKFVHDASGRKAQWRENLENALREMDKLRQTSGLPAAKARNACYKKQPMAPFMHRKTMKRGEIVKSGLSDA